jgi:hypothetical protein
MKTEETTDVVFKKFPVRDGGDIIALFPGVAGTNDPYTCSSYMHIGQHGSATVDLARLSRATEAEYASLARELRSLGYVLKIVRKFTRKHLAQRKAQIKR